MPTAAIGLFALIKGMPNDQKADNGHECDE